MVENLFVENIAYCSDYDEDFSPYIYKVKVEYRMLEPQEL